ncbi:MAG: TonB-dependent receptor [Rubrivivax sp.]
MHPSSFHGSVALRHPFPVTALAAACLWLCHGTAIGQPTTEAAPALTPPSPAPSQVIITGQRREAQQALLPATVESVSAVQIEEISNTPTTAGVLQYLPSVHVRERYIGDRNSILVMRVNSSVASAQTTVYADGLLLSNFLNNSFATAPRWGMVSPEEIERVEVIYGPFSAQFPGNSAGGVVRIHTRMPTRFEAHAKLDAFSQRFREYGTNNRFSGGRASVSLGDARGAFSGWLSAERLDNQGHPQTFGTATAKPGAPAAAGTFTVVDASRVYRDIDTSGNPRVVVASTGIDHTVQDMLKLKLGWQITPAWQASYTLGLWQNASDTSVDSYLRDTTGRTVYNAGSAMANPLKFVRIDGVDYTVSAAAPSLSRSEHRMHGLALRSNTGGLFDLEVVASVYDQAKDLSRSATPSNGVDNGFGATRPGGQLTDAAGTGWDNIDVRGQWRLGAHTVSAGLHHNTYRLASVTYGTSAAPITDWMTSTTGTLNTNSYGKTRTQAAYVQNEWRVAEGWTLAAGARQERWQAFDGSNYNAANAAPNPKNLVYANRSYSHLSPKAYLHWAPNPAWAVRVSVGKAVRYPTVAEMFQTFNGPNGIRFNDPNLKPEQVLSTEWVAERRWGGGSARASLFTEDKRDALISQTDVTVTPNISSIQNVDKVRTSGLELAAQASDVGVRGLELNGSLTYTDSTIVRNTRNPGLEGTHQPRIPRWRATAVATWRASERLSASLAYRYSGRQHNALFNTTLQRYNDINPNVYGAVSHYSVFDAKLLYRIDRHWTASLGINNIGSFKYYVNPNPYPQRTWFGSLKYDL